MQISDEEFMRRKKGERPSTIDGLTDFDKDRVGKAIRIEIPMTDRLTLELTVELLRGLANEIEFTLQRQDLPLVARLQMIRDYAWTVCRRIRDRFERSQAR